jgi:hypothetical protein
LSSNVYQKAAAVLLTGDKYSIYQKMQQGGERSDKCYELMQFYRGTGDNRRLKVYQQPCKTTPQFSGEAEVFNDGDSIKVHVERVIKNK